MGKVLINAYGNVLENANGMTLGQSYDFGKMMTEGALLQDDNTCPIMNGGDFTIIVWRNSFGIANNVYMPIMLICQDNANNRGFGWGCHKNGSANDVHIQDVVSNNANDYSTLFGSQIADVLNAEGVYTSYSNFHMLESTGGQYRFRVNRTKSAWGALGINPDPFRYLGFSFLHKDGYHQARNIGMACVYDRLLTDTEAEYMYNSGAGNAPIAGAGLVGYYPMNEAVIKDSKVCVPDYSGHNNDLYFWTGLLPGNVNDQLNQANNVIFNKIYSAIK